MTDVRNMTSQSSEMPRRRQRYRRSEHALWAHYGLTPKEHWIDLESPRVRLRVTEVGEGRPVLCVGGTGGSGPYWGALLQRIESVRWLILDRPGFLLSEPLDWSRHEFGPTVAAIQTGVLNALEVEKASLLGSSIGNLWVLRMALAHPERVDRLALMGGGPLCPQNQPPAFVKLLRTPLGALIVRIPQRRKLLERILRQNGHGTSLDEGRIPDAFIDWRLSVSNDTPTMREERALVKAIVGREGFIPGLVIEDQDTAAIRRPLLMVWGSHDHVGSAEVWKRFLGLMPDATFRILDGAGHLPWLDDPAQAARWVGEFLNS